MDRVRIVLPTSYSRSLNANSKGEVYWACLDFDSIHSSWFQAIWKLCEARWRYINDLVVTQSPGASLTRQECIIFRVGRCPFPIHFRLSKGLCYCVLASQDVMVQPFRACASASEAICDF